MPNKFESWQIFKVAKKALGPGALRRIYSRSTRLIDLWSANPIHCEITARNPLDRLRLLLDELDSAGREDYARAAIDYLAEPLGGKFAPLSDEYSDKQDIDGELADLFTAGGMFASLIREALSDDGQISTSERIIIKQHARRVIAELNQVLDAAGMKGGA